MLFVPTKKSIGTEVPPTERQKSIGIKVLLHDQDAAQRRFG
jgi:hypothetical protein